MLALLGVLAAVWGVGARGAATCAACSVVLGLVLEDGGKGPSPSAMSPDAACDLAGLCNATQGCVLWKSWPNVSSPTTCIGRGEVDGSPCWDGGAIDDTKTFPNGSTGLGAVQRVGGGVGEAQGNAGEGETLVAQLEAAGAKFGARRSDATHVMHALDQVARLESELQRKGDKMDFFQAYRLTIAGAAASATLSRTGGSCSLFDLGCVASSLEGAAGAREREMLGISAGGVSAWPCDILNISCIAQHVFDAHLPLADNDGDNFAGGDVWLFSDGFRGASWRGRDCNESNANAYPGRRAMGGDVDADSNCNGIFGVDGDGNSYEEAFCSGENAPMGIAILGDSATAHFSLPPQYLNARRFPALDNLTHALQLLSNEADWPQCSWSTGFRSTEGCPLSTVPMASLYQRLFEQNHCIHRDFQNLGVNGARADSLANPIEQSLARSQTKDVPLLVFVAVIGNDVCNSHPGMSHMTTPADFLNATLTTLHELDRKVPNGSHVAFVPLVDGRILWETTHNETHPTGASYPELYEELICADCTPCRGWMNPNETFRNLTSERAANLSAQYDVIIQHHSHEFSHFDMFKMDFDIQALSKQWIQKGGEARDLIEPSDGFHPSQVGNQLIAEEFWKQLQQNKPNWLPKKNPHNKDIEKLFGDQGGY